MTQIKYSLDTETLIKIGKGALIAGTGTAALVILNALGQIEFSNVALTGFVAWFVPFSINFVKEWMKGVNRT